MKTCMNCGRSYPEDLTVCPACRSALDYNETIVTIEVDAPAEESRNPYRENAAPQYTIPPQPAAREADPREVDPREADPRDVDPREYRRPVPPTPEYPRQESVGSRPNPMDPSRVQSVFRTIRSLTAVQQLCIIVTGLCIAISTHFNVLRVNGFLLMDGNYFTGIGIGLVIAAAGAYFFWKTYSSEKELNGIELECACASSQEFLNLFGRMTRPAIKRNYWPAVLAGMLLFLFSIALWEECGMLLHPMVAPQFAGYYAAEHMFSLAAALGCCAIMILHLLKTYYAIPGAEIYNQLLLRERGGCTTWM